ncbi:hypothetical protein LTR17_025823 [Elasticomyces elasticus]|nr:hypothetical protein LTR17_025823 [Elasticomyces elasticus]
MQPGQVSADPLTKSRWTLEYMTALTALNEDFNLAKGTPGRGEHIGRIFRRVFRIDLGTTHTTDLSNKKILDYYDSRNQKGRTQHFKDVVEANPPSAAQQARMAKVLPLLRQAVVDEGLGSVVVERNLPVAVQGANGEDEDDEDGEEEVEEGDETNKEVVKVESDGEYDEVQSRRSHRHAKRNRSSEVQPSEPVTKRSRTSKADGISGIRDSLVDQYGEGVVVKAESSNREIVYSGFGREVKPTAITNGNHKARSAKTDATTTGALTNGLAPSLPEAPSQDVDVWNTFANSEHSESRKNGARPETGSRKDKHGFLPLMRETMPHLSEMMKKTGSPKALHQKSTAQGAEEVNGQVDASSPTGVLGFVGTSGQAVNMYSPPKDDDFEDAQQFDLNEWAIETRHRDAEIDIQGGRLDGQGYGITDHIEGNNGMLNDGFDATSNLFGMIGIQGKPLDILAGGKAQPFTMHSPAAVRRFGNNGTPFLPAASETPMQGLHARLSASKSKDTPANSGTPYFNNAHGRPHISGKITQYTSQILPAMHTKPKYMFDTIASPRRENESKSQYARRVIAGVVYHGPPLGPPQASRSRLNPTASQDVDMPDVSANGSDLHTFRARPAVLGPKMTQYIIGYPPPAGPPPSKSTSSSKKMTPGPPQTQREKELMAFIDVPDHVFAVVRSSTDAEVAASMKLPMIHVGTFAEQGITSAYAPDEVIFVDEASKTFKLGGRLYRAFELDGDFSDVMVCNVAVCEQCKDFYEKPSSAEEAEVVLKEAERTEGLPVVHTADCIRIDHDHWYYSPRGAWPYCVTYPAMQKRKVVFTVWGAKEEVMVKEAMMCEVEHCEDCQKFLSG